jgi:MraZ protein
MLPANWRKMISGGVYLTQGFDQNLLVLTEGTFKGLYQQITSLNIADPLARLFSRMFLGKAVFLDLDKNGVFVIPSSLMDYANLNGELVLVGQGEYLEVWSPEQWDQQQGQINDAQANSQRFSTFTISAH